MSARQKNLGGENMQVQTIPLIIVSAYLIGMLVVGFLVSKLKI